MLFLNQKQNRLSAALKPSWSFGVIAFGQAPYFPTGNIILVAPLHKAFAFFANFYNYTDAAIACLLRSRSPSAITWLVVSVIIAPVQRVALRWSQTNVSVKVFKAIQPSSANTNATASIYCVLLVIGIVASSFHTIPRPMFWGVTKAMSFLVVIIAQSFGSAFALKTSAAYCVANAQVGGGHYCCGSTIAAAFPKRISSFWWRRSASQYDKSAKSFSFKRMNCHATPYIVSSEHNNTWGK